HRSVAREHAMPTGLLMTRPTPTGVVVIDSSGEPGGGPVKDAVQVFDASIVTVMLARVRKPVHAPPQPVNCRAGAGTAVRSSVLPAEVAAPQRPAIPATQSMPASPVTRPCPARMV